MQGLAGCRHVRHQLGRRLKIPVSIGHMGVPQIGAQGGDMPCYRLGIVRTAFERANGECVAKIVETWSLRSWSAAQADRSNDLQEDSYHCRIGGRRSLMRNEECIALARGLQASGEVSVQCAPGR